MVSTVLFDFMVWTLKMTPVKVDNNLLKILEVYSASQPTNQQVIYKSDTNCNHLLNREVVENQTFIVYV